MGLATKVIHLVILMSLIGFDFVAQGFAGSILSPSPSSRSNIQSLESHLNGSPISPVMLGPLPLISHQRTAPNFDAPGLQPIFLVPAVAPPEMLGQKAPTISPVMPPVAPPMLSEPAVSSTLAPLSMPVASPPNETPSIVSPSPSSEDYSPDIPPTHKTIWHSINAPSPAPITSIKSYPNKGFQSPALSPLSPFYKIHHPKVDGHAPATSPSIPPYASKQGPETSLTSPTPENFQRRRRRRAYPPLKRGSPVPSSYSHYPLSNVSPASSPSPADQSHHARHAPFLSPTISPSGFSSKKPMTPPPLPPVLVFPPPPPNDDCASILCAEPLTNTPSGSPCGCVWPMQVGLRLDVSFYTFFPLVSELAQEIASGVFMRQSQVRIMGANEANQEPDKTNVLIDLVPLGTKFDNTTAYLTYERLQHKQVAIIPSLFGDYEVLYIRYPGLPDSPPQSDSNVDATDVMNSGQKNGSISKPFGVDVRRRHHKNGLSGSVIAIIALSISIAVVLGSAVAWILMFKCTYRAGQSSPAPQGSLSSLTRPEGFTGSMIHSDPSFVSISFGSSIPPYTGSTKTFSSNEIEQATDGFNSSRIIGEGGFGRVYSGILVDGTKVAIKTIKRDDQQGGREFMAEVEMLSRLHHRNLVKLIGICTEENRRCLVYELIPNGSVESHLHGIDKETLPLDWVTRMKIALGAARGLAYLHEDSSPRVIHRDFKSSNILLEHDFTPKVSDFGLARTATDEEDMHISTRVMGTFGYVAPEYAMTGHLLVKSDVYSYGVVLLELLTGKKPIDMSQPMGLENLVAWARPLLTSKEGIDSIVDASLKSSISFDSISKVSAIASMCVQPEVSHRPFMSEVVQALKLVCDEVGSKRYSQEDLCIDLDHSDTPGTSTQSQVVISNVDVEKGFKLSNLELFGASGSFTRPSSSSPLRIRKGRRFWRRFGRSSRGSMSEHGVR